MSEDELGDANSATFLFEVDGVDIGRFEEVSGLEVSIETEDIPEGGQNSFIHKMPGRMSWPNIVLKRGVTKQDNLLSWFNESSGEQFSANGNKLVRKSAAITLLDRAGKRCARGISPTPIRSSGPDRRFAAGLDRRRRRRTRDHPPRIPSPRCLTPRRSSRAPRRWRMSPTQRLPRCSDLAWLYRARSQSVLGRHWSPSGVVGAVGRASVGFGLAVGRSRSIRPTVRFDDLNSAALRPSFDVWRRQRTGDADVDDGHSRRDDAGGAERPDRAPPDGSHAGCSGRRRMRQFDVRPNGFDAILSVDPGRRGQIRSSNAARSDSSHPPPEVPCRCHPFPRISCRAATPKLDQLRLLMRQREEGADRGTTTAERATSRAGTKVPDSGADQTVLRRTTAAEPTVSVAADGPGRLARAMRPESALAPTVPQARLGEPPAPAGSGSRSPDGRTVASVAQRSAAPGRPATRSRRSAEPPSRLEQLRAALIQQGLLADGTDDVVGESSAGNDNVGAQRGPRAETRRCLTRQCPLTSGRRRSWRGATFVEHGRRPPTRSDQRGPSPKPQRRPRGRRLGDAPLHRT